jgi:hypothetical protein
MDDWLYPALSYLVWRPSKGIRKWHQLAFSEHLLDIQRGWALEYSRSNICTQSFFLGEKGTSIRDGHYGSRTRELPDSHLASAIH